jgi:hypothetical protein
VQPLWKPAQPQSEQRQLIPRDSFFLLLSQLFGKTILSESHSGQRSILLDMKGISTIHKDWQFSSFVSQINQLISLNRSNCRKVF